MKRKDIPMQTGYLIESADLLKPLKRRTNRGAWTERLQGRTLGARGPAPFGPEKTQFFSGFLPLNCAICIFEVCFLSFLLCGRAEEAWSTIKGLRKVNFSHSSGHYIGKNYRPHHP